ncbi:MAG: hypothetical protein WC884_04380 [Candidatus Paceibacterota bacterium]
MPKFEELNSHNDGNKGQEEMTRLYGNDLSAKSFETSPYKTATSISENAGLYGEEDDSSAEEKIYERITPEEDKNNLTFGKISNDYLNGIGEMPKGLDITQVRKSALAYRESLSEEDQKEEAKKVSALIRSEIKNEPEAKYTKSADLEPNLMAQATPHPLEQTKLNRRSLWSYIVGNKKRA